MSVEDAWKEYADATVLAQPALAVGHKATVTAAYCLRWEVAEMCTTFGRRLRPTLPVSIVRTIPLQDN